MKMKMIFLLAAAAAAGVVVGAWGLGSPDPAVDDSPLLQFLAARTQNPEANGPDRRSGDFEPNQYVLMLNSLSEIVEQEINERLYLEEQVSELQAQVAQMETLLGNTPAETSAAARAASRSRPRSDITEESFVEAGFSPAEAAYLKQQRDEAAMARLYLRDRAMREGWFRTDRYFEELGQLPDSLGQLRAQMDDTSYDRYLFAVGRPNRVAVVSVMENSAAQQAGLEPGDVIYRYDGERLFNTRSVLSASRGGEFGDAVPVEVMRDGQRHTVYMPRGPLGVRMNAFSAKPQ